jgi:hypothetical protein
MILALPNTPRMASTASIALFRDFRQPKIEKPVKTYLYLSTKAILTTGNVRGVSQMCMAEDG